MTTNWMDDPSLIHIDKEKLLFLQSLVFESQNLSKEQLLPFLMAIAKRGKDNNITFTDDEMNAITAVIRSHAAPEEIDKINKLMALRKSRTTR